QTGRRVALKLLHSQVSAADAQRFAREAQILGELRDPHIIPYVAHGVDENNQPYPAMEWLDGENLPSASAADRSACATPQGSRAAWARRSPRRISPAPPIAISSHRTSSSPTAIRPASSCSTSGSRAARCPWRP